MPVDVYAPLLALLGTLITVGAAYAQWRRSHSRARNQTYAKRRAEVLGELREVISSLEVASRLNRIDKGELRDQLPLLNTFIIKHRAFLCDDECEWATTYLNRLTAIDSAIRERAPDEEDEWWGLTQRRPSKEEVAVLRSWDEALNVSDRLAKRYADALKAVDSSAAI